MKTECNAIVGAGKRADRREAIGSFGSACLGETVVRLYLGNISLLDHKECVQACQEAVTQDRLSRLERFRFEADQKRSLLAGYLLSYGLKQCFPGFSLKEEAFGKTEQGKPFLKDNPALHFNLSHSGDWVLCGIAGQEIGVDIQQEEKVSNAMARRICSEEEIHASPGLISLWTIKEAYSKLKGLGLLQDFRQLQVLFEEGRVIQLDEKSKMQSQAELLLPKAPAGYCIAVCTAHRSENWKLEQIQKIEVLER